MRRGFDADWNRCRALVEQGVIRTLNLDEAQSESTVGSADRVFSVASEMRESRLSRIASRLLLLHGWRRLLLAFIAGGLASFSQAPFDFFAVCLISFPVLVWLLDGAAADSGSGRMQRFAAPFVTGWWFGFGYFAGGLWWVGNAMLTDFERYAWALPIAVLLLPAILAVFYGLAAALARPFWSDGFGRIAALAAAFGIAEWLRAVLFTGFPWNAVGYAVMPTPLLMQSVGVVGMMGVNALAVLVFSLPALLAGEKHVRAGMALAVVLAALHVAFGFLRLSLPAEGDETLLTRIVQPSIDQSEKWNAAVRDRIFKTFLDLSAQQDAQDAARPAMILWPETSVPFILQDRPDALSAIGELVRDDQVLLAGAVRIEGENAADPDARFYNSVVAINSAGVMYDAVDKAYLVPLGEFVPLEALFSRLGIAKLVELPGGFSRGVTRHAIDVSDGISVVPYVCYEVIFPGIAVGDTENASLIVNVTNDGWFGHSPGPYQHLRQAQLRAVEAGRPLVRAANNGLSAVIDARGQLVDALALDAVGTLDVAVPLAPANNLRTSHAGTVGWAIVLALALLAAMFRWRQKSLKE